MTNTPVFDPFESGKQHNLGYEVGKVCKTDDYDLFKLSTFNRNVILKKEMLAQAQEGLISPIIVNENFVVIDGQHRFTAAKQVGVPIEYIVKPGLGEHDIVRMNTIQRKWSLDDYITAFANRGLNEYIRLTALVNKKVTNTTELVEISIDTMSASEVRKHVENGSFRFFNYDKTVEFLSFYSRFRKETNTPKRSSVTLALWNLFKIEKLDRERLIRKVIASGLNEEIKIKNYTRNDILKSILTSYNNKLSFKSKQYINYITASNGTIVIQESVQKWAEK